MGLWYPKDSSFELTAFSDLDHAGCIDSRKSAFGGIQFLGDKLVSWMSKKQNCTAMSSVEAEYVALSASCAQGALKGKWRYLISAKPPIHYHVLIPNYQDFKIQDFRYSDGFECFQAINIGRYEHIDAVMQNDSAAEETEGITLREKARTTLLIALPEDHLEKFHKMADAKEMWEAIKSRFSGNDESKKMHKYLLKQQFEGFSVSASEGIHKGYDRFQTLLSQLEIHGAGVSHEYANQKVLRSLPSSWSQLALIMRTKPGLHTLSFDDLYNNLRVFERDVKGTTASSSSNTQNLAFMSADNTSSTNDVSTVYSVSSPSVSKSHKEGSSSYIDEVIHYFFANQSSAHQLDCNDLEQINDDDIEEMDLKLQVAMISMRIKKFHKRTGRKLQFDTRDPVGFDKTKVECFNCHKMWHFARDCRAKGNQDNRRRDVGYNGNKARDNGRRPAYQDDSKALVTIDG
nr:hypothetical protein [Tanacetum cinerariifolium]